MKKIVSIMTLMLFAMVLNLSAQTVYVTENGKKYHQKDCQYAKDAKPMSLADAKAKGYTPCSACCKDAGTTPAPKDASKQAQQTPPPTDAKKK